jgi:CheY-like chemotaxis protein
MFVQVGEGTHGGLGIGLALVKGLVELHGGSVEARSDGLNHGTEFRVRLPRTTAPVARAVDPSHRASTESRRVLIVDDNTDAADRLADLLRDSGHEVEVCYDAEGALRCAASFRPDVGLFDVGLPGMNGYQLAERVRQGQDGSPMLLVAITGWGQDEDRRAALAAGFDAHLTKPADPEAILALIAGRAASSAKLT